MRIYLDQFQTLVQSAASGQAKLYPIYLLSSEEDTLLNACQEQLYGYLNKQGFSGPIYQTDPQSLFSSQRSLFSQKEIVVHKLAKSSADFTRDLTQHCKQLPEATEALDKIYVLLTGKLDKTQTKSKWVQCIESHGAVVTIWPPEGYKLKKWLSDLAHYHQVTLSDTQKNCILDNFPNNVSDVYQLIKMLSFCFNEEVITDDLLHQLLSHQPQYSAQQLIEALLACDMRRLLMINQHLHQQQKLLLTIWWLIQLFDWWQATFENKAATPTYFGASFLKNQAQNLPVPILQRIQLRLIEWKSQLFQLDIYAKNNQPLEAEHLLNQLLLSVVNTISAKQL